VCCEERTEEPNGEIGSIWRMPIDEKCRTKLMNTCEGWSRAHGCTTAGFYINRMGYKKTTEDFSSVNNWFAKLVIPPVMKYEKPYELILLYKAGKGNAGGFVLRILDDPILYF
jgi:hypothetical protein